MTQIQKKAFELLKFSINIQHGIGPIQIDSEDAKALKRLIENQEGYIKELLEQIDDLKEDHNLVVEKILDKVRYLCGMKDRDNNQVYVMTKDELNTLERRLKGEE